MGEIAEMMLDGTLCEGCGVYMAGGGNGVPQRCGACELDDKQPAPGERVVCKSCHCLVKAVGLADHMRDKHGSKKHPRPQPARHVFSARCASCTTSASAWTSRTRPSIRPRSNTRPRWRPPRRRSTRLTLRRTSDSQPTDLKATHG